MVRSRETPMAAFRAWKSVALTPFAPSWTRTLSILPRSSSGIVYLYSLFANTVISFLLRCASLSLSYLLKRVWIFFISDAAAAFLFAAWMSCFKLLASLSLALLSEVILDCTFCRSACVSSAGASSLGSSVPSSGLAAAFFNIGFGACGKGRKSAVFALRKSWQACNLLTASVPASSIGCAARLTLSSESKPGFSEKPAVISAKSFDASSAASANPFNSNNKARALSIASCFFLAASTRAASALARCSLMPSTFFDASSIALSASSCTAAFWEPHASNSAASILATSSFKASKFSGTAIFNFSSDFLTEAHAFVSACFWRISSIRARCSSIFFLCSSSWILFCSAILACCCAIRCLFASSSCRRCSSICCCFRRAACICSCCFLICSCWYCCCCAAQAPPLPCWLFQDWPCCAPPFCCDQL
mmetsp:Transcript_87059/g.251453  ORF Transcript_87059/g.251453 Transcript_87059/m.251453 type:complete len:421 (-) Transcript_87059:102-1364(-)